MLAKSTQKDPKSGIFDETTVDIIHPHTGFYVEKMELVREILHL